jgi:seryl-tRNA synthetase
MLDIKYALDHVDEVRARLRLRGPAAGDTLEPWVALADERRQAVTELESLRAQRNAANDTMAKLAKTDPSFSELRDTLRALSGQIKAQETRVSSIEESLHDMAASIPNLPDSTVPAGDSSEHNREIRRWGDKPSFDFTPQDHVALGESLGVFDFERAAKLSGSRFCVLKGDGALLERALISFMLDLHVREHGYTEIWPPALVKSSALMGTGQLPKFEEDLFQIQRAPEAPQAESPPGREPTSADHLYLIPTAEVPLTNLHAREIFEPGALPVLYTAYTPCFRSEAGSYGRDTRGLIRQHQFDKVELVQFVEPEHALDALQALTRHAERVLQALGLHYRVVELCAGDLGFASQKTYDLEVWLPGQQAYREISSCSWFGDFQARRANIRYRSHAQGKPAYVHTLNGSGLAIGRTLVALLEQNQTADGSVTVPEALRPYARGLHRLQPATASRVAPHAP